MNQRYLGYWNCARDGRHYITAYGHDHRNTGYLWVGVPAFSTRRFPSLQETYTAIRMKKGLVVW